MDSAIRRFETWVIPLQLLLGVVLSIIFFVIINRHDEFLGRDYLGGIMIFFGAVSSIFFLSVITVGVIGAIRAKRAARIADTIMYSIAFWLLSLVIIAISVGVLRIFSVYIMLAGITFGFNYGLGRHTVDEPKR